jgi:hypothetical protein
MVIMTHSTKQIGGETSGLLPMVSISYRFEIVMYSPHIAGGDHNTSSRNCMISGQYQIEIVKKIYSQFNELQRLTSHKNHYVNLN